MRINTFKSLVTLTLYAVLSTSVVAIPIQGQDVHNAVTQRSLADVDGMGSSLYRRNATTSGRKAPARSGSVSGSQGLTRSPTLDSTKKGAYIINICLRPNAAPKVGKRGFFENILYGRAGPQLTLQQIDPGYAHHVSAGPNLNGLLIAEGLYGAVYKDPSDARHVIKHIVSSQFFQINLKELLEELNNINRASRLINWYYTTVHNTATIKEVWVHMPKVPGTSLTGLGFDIEGFDNTPPALQRGRPARKVFLDRVLDLTVERAVYYATHKHIMHLDLHPGNVMVVFKPGTTTYEVQSVDLVDWGMAENSSGCTPQDVAQIRAGLQHRFTRIY